MAFGARRVYPNDVRPRVASGVDLPFSEPGVFTPNYLTRDAVKNNLINYLLTNPGEIPSDAKFGVGLYGRLFLLQTEPQIKSLKKGMFKMKLVNCFIEFS